MARYTVRCCCTPLKILGYLDLPREGIRDGMRHPLLTRPVLSLRAGLARDQTAISQKYETALFRAFRDPENDINEIAVYSEDRRIEFWRNIVGFAEAQTKTPPA